MYETVVLYTAVFPDNELSKKDVSYSRIFEWIQIPAKNRAENGAIVQK